MTRLLFGVGAMALALCTLSSVASAQTIPTARIFRDSGGSIQSANGMFCVPAVDGSGCPSSIAPAPLGSTSTTTSGTVTTANTYQSILAADSARKGCLVQNTSTATELLFIGAPGSATAANSFTLAAGGTFSCASGPIIVTDQLSVTSGTTGSPFVVAKQ